jgi:hypothetical protein
MDSFTTPVGVSWEIGKSRRARTSLGAPVDRDLFIESITACAGGFQAVKGRLGLYKEIRTFCRVLNRVFVIGSNRKRDYEQILR